MKVLGTIVAVVAIFNGPYAFAHGEERPGPNGGFIRMPGAYHTEIVPVSKNKVKVFLLDINWKNPTVENSKLEVSFVGEKTSEGKCRKESSSFVCTFDASVDLRKNGKLLVNSVRLNQRGAAIEYVTPLKF